MRIILASSSPRRRELLALTGLPFEIIPADVDETVDSLLSPQQLVTHLSEKKAFHLQASYKDAIIIGADTVVAIDNLILGKPINETDAFNMLYKLQGCPHTVFTGVTVTSGKLTRTFVESTDVFMRPLSEKEIWDYIATKEPFDKAGAYGIQEKGAVLIERVEGDYFTVVGLPICRLNMVLKEFL